MILRLESTRAQKTSVDLPASLRSVVVVTVPAPSQGRTPRAWLVRFALAFLGAVAGSYAVMEALSLRFCQPLRCEHMHKVFFFQQEVRDPAVVYLGTSQVHYGVMPGVMEEEARKQGVIFQHSYNLAVPGAELELSWILARDTLKGHQKPQLLVVGVWPLVMAGNDSGEPQYVARYGDVWDVAGRVRAGELALTELAAVSLRGVETLVQYPFHSLKKPLPQYRCEHLRRGQGGWWLPEEAAHSEATPAGDWQAMLEKLDNRRDLRFDDHSRPAGLLRSFRTLAAERGFQLVIVNLPQHPQLARQLYARGNEQDYQAWIASFCAREGIHYLDLDERQRYGQADFGDPVHLSARGADKFSRELARRLRVAR